jgi:hypothetical protein
MRSEHDDDMDPEVNEGAEGETEKYAVVAEDIEQRDAEAAELERARLEQPADGGGDEAGG